MPSNPLAEVFGFPVRNLSSEAERYRNNKLCPFHNNVPSCTKDRVNDPLGVCSVHIGDKIAITCPVRFRQDWIIIEDAASFVLDSGTSWTSLHEVSLKDANGQSAGNLDYVLVAYDSRGRIVAFGSLEVQAVYISGNVRRPFEYYMADRPGRMDMAWTATNVRPDYLSSSRKRLVPQMIYKGGILNAWGKKQAVALQDTFYETLPPLPTVEADDAELVWLVYGLDLSADTGNYQLVRRQTVYTRFQAALETITTPGPGALDQFMGVLQEKLNEKLQSDSAPQTPRLFEP